MALPRRQLRTLHLFAGAGGGILADLLLGHRPVCAVELDPYCRRVLLARQRDGHLPRFPIWDDVCTFDGGPWRGAVDVVAGGFPCQDISCAGKGAGIDGERSGLWGEMARVVREVRPRFVFVENSPMLTSRGLGRVLGDLAEMGFDARWGVLGADDAGAPHRRKRIWVVADADCHKLRGEPRRGAAGARRPCPTIARYDGTTRDMANAAGVYAQRRQRGQGEGEPRRGGRWLPEPDVGRVADGVASRVDRLRAIGNGQVSSVAALAWEILR